MKKLILLLLVGTIVLDDQSSLLPISSVSAAPVNPRISSWLTAPSGQYARLYRTYADEQADTAVSVWSNTNYAQEQPAYAGVQKVSHSGNFVYLRTTGLALGHVMGPWYNNTGAGGALEVFGNWPEAIYGDYRFPLQPTIPSVRTPFPGGAIGLMVDGTVIFSSSDAYSWDNNEDGTGNGKDTLPGPQAGGFGDGIWNHDAYITESNTFDKSNSHAAGNQLHYHAAPMKLRFLLGDSVQAVRQANGEFLYSDNFNGTHSPILGWMNDGYPLYGPYGFSNPDDPTSPVRRMISGFIVRDGSNGTYDIPSSGRVRLPAWMVRSTGRGPDLTVNQKGPTHAAVPVPYFMEDYDFKGDLQGFSPYDGTGIFDENRHYDMNEFNVRFCRTPEFPDGTWAYFTCIDGSGNPTFPYNVGRDYFGDPAQGGIVRNITEDLTTDFEGGPNLPVILESPSVNGDTVTLTWNGAEGGSYTVESADDPSATSWTEVVSGVITTSNQGSATDASRVGARFYRVTRTALAAYDAVGSASGAGEGGGQGGGGGGGAGGITIGQVTPNSADPGSTVSVSITLSGAMLPPANVAPTAVSIGSIAATSITYDGSVVTAVFTLPEGTTGAQDLSVTLPPPPNLQDAVVITSAGAFTITGTQGGTGGGGGAGISSVSPQTGTRGTSVTLSIELDPAATPAVPPANAPLPAVTVGAINATQVARNNNTITATLVIPPNAPIGTKEIVVTFEPAPGKESGPSYKLAGVFRVD
ncbi:MAG: YHYH protein [Verrucomicrobia bacterium]|nr:YHYH protein [Verrucomicrobiota bacterium]